MPQELTVPFKIKKQMGSLSAAELIVNAEMEQVFFDAEEAGIYGVDGKWYIRDYGKGLQLSNFVENDNLENCHFNSVSDPVDMGLVNAIAYLIFSFVDVVVHSKYNTFTFKIASYNSSDRTGELKIIYSEPFDTDFIGTLFEYTNPNNKEMLYAQYQKYKYWENVKVEKTPYGQIISKPTNKGAVFVNGVKIAHISEPHFVFNITSVSKPLKNAILLNRFSVPKQFYEESLKKMLLAAKTLSIAIRFVKNDHLNDHQKFFDEKSWKEIMIHFIKIMNRVQLYFFISDIDLIHKSRYQYYVKDMFEDIITIKHSLIRSLHGVNDDKGNPIKLKNHLLRQYKSKSFVEVKYAQLNDSEKKTYACLRFIFHLFGGKPKEIDKIKIVEIPDWIDTYVYLRKCFYNEKERTLFVNRVVLNSKKQFITVMIRELITVVYGYKPISAPFESKMLEIMGDITAQYIHKKKT